MADETPKVEIDAQNKAVEVIKKAELKTRASNASKSNSSGNSAASLIKGLLFFNKGSYFQISNDKHIKLFHADGSSVMTFVDGIVNLDAKTSITEKSPKHYIDSPDVKVGSNASHPDTRCDQLMDLLDQLMTLVDVKVGGPVSAPAKVLISSMKSVVCSDVVKIA